MEDVRLEGVSVMYLCMPMSPLSIPVVGACQLLDRRLTLKFPTSKIAFELPKALVAPADAKGGAVLQEFKMAGPRGDMKVTLSYDASLKAFLGKGTDIEEGSKYLTFILIDPSSALAQATQIREKERVSCGLDVVVAGDLNAVVEEGLASFEFVCVPIVHPRFRRDFSNCKLKRDAPLTRSDFLLSSNDWTSVIVAKISTNITTRLDSPDPVTRSNAQQSFQQEFSLAMHLNVPAVMVELRSADCLNMARCVSASLHASHNCAVWVRVPLVPQKDLLDDLCSGDQANLALDQFPPLSRSAPSPLKHVTLATAPESTWHWWNRFETLVESHARVGVALELTADLPSSGELSRWEGERVKAVVLPTKIFLSNKKGFPVLSTQHQAFLKSLKTDVQFVLSGRNRHTNKSHYKMYLSHLRQQRSHHNSDIIASFARGYEDYLQCPLQPLMDNLESQTYETFEKDPIKYLNYQKAIHLALLDRRGEEVVVMVLGAGRGPLVQATLQAALDAKKKVKVFAVEKNPHAVVTLKNIKTEEWGERVVVVEGDMRQWQTEERADVIVSELLGSFGDNELSPECLDGAERFLKEDAVSIPCAYTSYVAPVHSSKLWNEARSCKDASKPPGAQFETPYVVRLHNSRLIAPPKPLFTFQHPHHLTPSGRLSHSNNRHSSVHFNVDIDTMLHGFAGYFHCTLYKDVTISIEPSSHTPSMFSWFPIYLPLSLPLLLQGGSDLSVDFWRLVSEKAVWYEWCVTSPVVSKVHNLNGRSYTIGL